MPIIFDGCKFDNSGQDGVRIHDSNADVRFYDTQAIGNARHGVNIGRPSLIEELGFIGTDPVELGKLLELMQGKSPEEKKKLAEESNVFATWLEKRLGTVGHLANLLAISGDPRVKEWIGVLLNSVPGR
ncbi:hypothetical protein FQZ97_1091570 [compost metagenome]